MEGKCSDAPSSRKMTVEEVEVLVDELLNQIPQDQGQAVITVKADHMPSPGSNGQKPPGIGPKYDPSLAYILEFCTVLVLRDSHTIQALTKPVVAALQEVLRDSKNYHSLVVARATYYKFKILQASYVRLIRLAYRRSRPADRTSRSMISSGPQSYCTPSLASRRIPFTRYAGSYCKG